jgi:hypothetical protein
MNEESEFFGRIVREKFHDKRQGFNATAKSRYWMEKGGETVISDPAVRDKPAARLYLSRVA